MRTDQRESILMLLDLSHRNAPALYAVAVLAIGAHLPAMDVSVTIGARMANVGEQQLGVALRACHARVHAAQRVPSTVVIELRQVADGFPRRERVAVLAGLCQRAVRASRLRAWSRLLLGGQA